MRVQTPLELSAVARHARKQLGITQAQLAERIGVGRLWVVRFEQGKAEVELGIALRALRALGVALHLTAPRPDTNEATRTADAPVPPWVDLDALLRESSAP